MLYKRYRIVIKKVVTIEVYNKKEVKKDIISSNYKRKT